MFVYANPIPIPLSKEEIKNELEMNHSEVPYCQYCSYYNLLDTFQKLHERAVQV